VLPSVSPFGYGRKVTAIRLGSKHDRQNAADHPVSSRKQIAAGRALLTVQVVLLVAMTTTVATRVWQDHVWVGFLLMGVTLVAWIPELTRQRVRRWWFIYVAGIFAYTLLRSFADETGIPIQTAYVIQFDRMLFIGNDAIPSLQRRLFSPTNVSFVDWAAVVIHWSFFIAPHALAVAIFLFRRHLFPAYVTVIVGTMYAGLLFFFLVPTTPPWLAAQSGDLPYMFRIMDFVGGHANADTYGSLYESLGEPNPVAAMPSIHFGVTFAMYLWARGQFPRFAHLLLAYSFVMGVSLLYLAEHYAFDLVVGLACALAVHLVALRFLGSYSPLRTTSSSSGPSRPSSAV
jgi:membrane-associated phospholipid phosphatase